MKVAELTQLLQAFDHEMKVLMTRSDTRLENVVACYDDLVCQGRVYKCDRSRIAGECHSDPCCTLSAGYVPIANLDSKRPA